MKTIAKHAHSIDLISSIACLFLSIALLVAGQQAWALIAISCAGVSFVTYKTDVAGRLVRLIESRFISKRQY